ncbi:hypothetical protein DYY67_1269 [Candidatus Nitrosotalea sp. TS]|nr:hypothetical protein [Candidatus Nitrosotalea sp. TS]
MTKIDSLTYINLFKNNVKNSYIFSIIIRVVLKIFLYMKISS